MTVHNCALEVETAANSVALTGYEEILQNWERFDHKTFNRMNQELYGNMISAVVCDSGNGPGPMSHIEVNLDAHKQRGIIPGHQRHFMREFGDCQEVDLISNFKSIRANASHGNTFISGRGGGILTQDSFGTTDAMLDRLLNDSEFEYGPAISNQDRMLMAQRLSMFQNMEPQSQPWRQPPMPNRAFGRNQDQHRFPSHGKQLTHQAAETDLELALNKLQGGQLTALRHLHMIADSSSPFALPTQGAIVLANYLLNKEKMEFKQRISISEEFRKELSEVASKYWPGCFALLQHRAFHSGCLRSRSVVEAMRFHGLDVNAPSVVAAQKISLPIPQSSRATRNTTAKTSHQKVKSE
jgi:hypothetical protein